MTIEEAKSILFNMLGDETIIKPTKQNQAILTVFKALEQQNVLFKSGLLKDCETCRAERQPYEKFESTKDHIYKLAGDYKCWDNRLTEDEAVELCHILEQQPCEDAISRQSAIEVAKQYWYKPDIAGALAELPSVQPYNTSEWCHDCKEYDQDKHCCPRYNKVIRNAVEEVKKPKTGYWIPVTERLPKDRNPVLVTAYWHETYQVMQASYFGDGVWWCVPFNNTGKHEQKLKPKAWMSLPKPYKPQESEK